MSSNPVSQALEEWLDSCKDTRGKVSRNTIAMGIVVLNHLRIACPVDRAMVLSRGEIVGSRTGLRAILESYGIPKGKVYLKEITTRQAPQDGQRLFDLLGWGASLASLPQMTRDGYLVDGIQSLIRQAMLWFDRQVLKVNCDRQLSPASWVGSILEQAKGQSGGKVEQHLVGAKLATRHPEIEVPNHPGHAGDVQTGRSGDFSIGTTCYHVTASPGRGVIEKCAENLRAGTVDPKNRTRK